MSGDSGRDLVCSACGSTRVRSSRPRGLREHLDRSFREVRFHVCSACGARGTHERGARVHRVGRAGRPGRGGDSRARAGRARIRSHPATLVLAVLLGAWLGLRAISCAASPPAPTGESAG